MTIKKKYEHLTFTFLMALGMSCIISFVTMLVRVGFTSTFLTGWMQSWGLAFVIAFPTAYFLPKGIRIVMRRITFVE